ncbi:MAG: hypothetical protein GC136_08110 [Alphaproteobacteria bacterium]|nr:hypothetical protein [Alphaproteobacteria bacterium]
MGLGNTALAQENFGLAALSIGPEMGPFVGRIMEAMRTGGLQAAEGLIEQLKAGLEQLTHNDFESGTIARAQELISTGGESLALRRSIYIHEMALSSAFASQTVLNLNGRSWSIGQYLNAVNHQAENAAEVADARGLEGNRRETFIAASERRAQLVNQHIAENGTDAANLGNVLEVIDWEACASVGGGAECVSDLASLPQPRQEAPAFNLVRDLSRVLGL